LTYVGKLSANNTTMVHSTIFNFRIYKKFKTERQKDRKTERQKDRETDREKEHLHLTILRIYKMWELEKHLKYKEIKTERDYERGTERERRRERQRGR
jgi:hypothetical protein